MADFSQYGGPSEEWLAIEKTLPPTVFDPNQEVVAFRKVVNDGREEASKAGLKALFPDGHPFTTEDYAIPTRDGSTIEARTYRPKGHENAKLPVYIHFHGGGFIFGTLSSEDATCAKTAVNAKAVVLNVNYRHTPEHTFPIAWTDAEDAFIWLHKNIENIGGDPQKVVVGGVSAGGQLTASLVLAQYLGKSEVLKGLPTIAGQILIIPCLLYIDTYDWARNQLKSPELSSYIENKDAPILPEKTVRFFVNLLKASEPDPKNHRLNPAARTSEEVKGLPPTVFGIAGLDPLRDEALLYAKLLSEAGVPTDTRLFKGVPHGFRRFGPGLSASKEWDAATEEGIPWVLSNPKATGEFKIDVR